jgi:signal transduction histidine kinase
MSHELRTPLNIIIGYTGLLREGAFGPLTPDQAETQERVDTKARELLDLIAATLDLSRLDTGRVKVDRGDIDLVALFREIDAETCEARHKPGVAYVCRLAPGLPALISDAQKLKIVVKNLVLNAAKFTDQGEIAVVVQPRNGGVEISVADTGIGIAPQILPHIFEPFRQADSSPTRRHDGVGLGLYIVRRFLDVLGGAIDVASQPGRGSTFRVWLPWQPAAANAAQGPLPRSGR